MSVSGSVAIPFLKLWKRLQRAPLVPPNCFAARASSAARIPLIDAAVAPLHLDKARHRRRHAEAFRVGGVDSAGERLRDAIEHLAPEASRHERVQAFVVVAAFALG